MKLRVLNGLFVLGLLLVRSAFSQVQPCDFSSEALLVASRIRELPILRSVECRALDKESFRSLAREIVNRDLNHKSLTAEGSFLKFLGIIPPAYDYVRCVSDGYASAAAAFYSPYLGYFVVPDWAAASKAVLVHEATHALQDQHFKTADFANGKPLLSDEGLAAGAVLEGDAMSVEEEYVRSAGGRALVPGPDLKDQLKTEQSGCELPAIHQALFHGLYDYGYHFVSELRAKGGWRAVNSALHRIPTTTEEVLRSKRYLAREKNRNLSIPRARVPGAELLFSAHVGEMVMRVLFKSELSDPRRAVLAAAGGAGDRAALYKVLGADDQELFIWESDWEREIDALEFWSAISEIWGARLGAKLNSKASSIYYKGSDGRELRLRRDGIRVRIEVSQIRSQSR